MADALVLTDIIRRLRRTVSAQLLLARADHTTHMTARNCHDRGVAQMRNANCDIDAFLDQVHDAIDEQDFGTDFRMVKEELTQDRRKMTPAEQHRRGDR